MKNKYYVYIYLDPTRPGNYNYGKLKFDYEPFYVGKGTNNRDIMEHDAKGISYRIRTINEAGLNHIIIRVYDNLRESIAYNKEASLIKLIGRNYDRGPLLNSTKKQKPRKARTSKRTCNEDMRNTAINELLNLFQ